MPNPLVKKETTVQNLKNLALVSRDGGGGPLPSLSNVYIGLALAGSSTGPMRLTCDGWNFSKPTPHLVLVQPRQSQFTDNQKTDFPDQFATQVMETENDSITILITRVDPVGEGIGWSQDLELDIFVVE